MNTIAPLPKNEMDRVINLSDYNLDYTSLDHNLKELARLAARITGSYTSLVNIIDSYTQWTVAASNVDPLVMSREESVCQWTINETDKLEVVDLKQDERFKDRDIKVDDKVLKYYYGIPLKTGEGHAIGALCVLNDKALQLTPEKEEILRIIGNEVINRLNVIKALETLKAGAHEAHESKKRVAHDIRGPLAGIIGLARVIGEQGADNDIDEVLEFVKLIHKSGNSLLELADEILSVEQPAVAQPAIGAHQFTQVMLKDKLEKLYALQAKNKQVNFLVTTNTETENIPFAKNKILQIVGNLISNAIKFTAANGTVKVNLAVRPEAVSGKVIVTVQDDGVGMTEAQTEDIRQGRSSSSNGTGGELGYGFGLALVKHLVESLKGKLEINSAPGKGTLFTVTLPQ